MKKNTFLARFLLNLARFCKKSSKIMHYFGIILHDNVRSLQQMYSMRNSSDLDIRFLERFLLASILQQKLHFARILRGFLLLTRNRIERAFRNGRWKNWFFVYPFVAVGCVLWVSIHELRRPLDGGLNIRVRIILGTVLDWFLIFNVHVPGCSQNGSGMYPDL